MAEKIIDEVRKLTEYAVVKKQDAAKLNFPKIAEKIKFAAGRGESEVRVSTIEMNEYDRALLVTEGFSVSLVDKEKSPYDHMRQYDPSNRNEKEWLIRW